MNETTMKKGIAFEKHKYYMSQNSKTICISMSEIQMNSKTKKVAFQRTKHNEAPTKNYDEQKWNHRRIKCFCFEVHRSPHNSFTE